jgi:hypothetical protein
MGADTIQTFDEIRRVRNGREFWSARDLMPLLGYGKWKNSPKVIDRARLSCDTAGYDIFDHFPKAGKMVPIGSTAKRETADFHLSRYAWLFDCPKWRSAKTANCHRSGVFCHPKPEVQRLDCLKKADEAFIAKATAECGENRKRAWCIILTLQGKYAQANEKLAAARRLGAPALPDSIAQKTLRRSRPLPIINS